MPIPTLLSPEPVVPMAALDALPWAHVTGRFRALGHDFAVRATDAAMGRYLEAVLDPLAAPGEARCVYSAVEDPGSDPPFKLYVDGRRALQALDGDLLVRLILWHVNQEVIRTTTSHLLVHASAAEHRGTALLMPARMESGKSTLVAALVQAGLRYLTDEAAAIDVDSLDVVPYPKAISLDPGAWALLPGLRPELGPELERYSSAQWHVDPRSIRGDAIAPTAMPNLVITPRFRAGATTRLEPIPRAEALLVLTDQAFNLKLHGSRGFQALAGVVRRSSCYRLVMGDLDPAVSLVLGLLDGAAPVGPRPARGIPPIGPERRVV